MSKNAQLKAGLWYTLCYFITKGLAFLITPIFARIMSAEDYGAFSSFNAWRNIFIIIFSMSVANSINRARFDYEGEVDKYIATIATWSVALPSVCYLIVLFNIEFFSRIFQMPAVYVHVLFWGIIFPHVLEIFIMKQRIEYKYKMAVAFTILNAATSLIMALVLVLLMEDGFMGRILGQAIPPTVIGVGLYIYVMVCGKKISGDMVKYAIVVSLPFVPHLLSELILTQSDRIIITDLLGSEKTAFYSIACSCSMLIHMFLMSVNSAWLPWFGEKMYEKNYEIIKSKARWTVLLFFAIYIGALLIGPEFLKVFGGEKYATALWAIPPLILVNMFQFINAQYVNLVQYEKKVWRIAVTTIAAAVINIAMNYCLVPIWGYVAAAYTTVFAHMVVCVLNYFSVLSIGFGKLYDNKFFIIMLAVSTLVCMFSYVMYEVNIIRYSCLLIYVMVAGAIAYKYRSDIAALLRRKK